MLLTSRENIQGGRKNNILFRKSISELLRTTFLAQISHHTITVLNCITSCHLANKIHIQHEQNRNEKLTRLHVSFHTKNVPNILQDLWRSWTRGCKRCLADIIKPLHCCHSAEPQFLPKVEMQCPHQQTYQISSLKSSSYILCNKENTSSFELQTYQISSLKSSSYILCNKENTSSFEL